ncbi:aminomethyl-transferring glycine dehydrogenase [Bartonella sp. TP]|uniref:aminomethyl-transferring glycine dehydrogenase n=1 Tax=Bartonella sp. TP TaxID=3057550 RepID=UPI0025B26DBC|nr:aminomethyl-transferring glycine dehydrogenase [Bartonella sp. TP]MDN5249257.1 aminomethyl-transferring glycine dehydrogenase [Alphaproteobacteria bacterium]WJW79656.1 aminomethyl-transferring glycine dehydrogenase [Bartonella sp. TP]
MKQQSLFYQRHIGLTPEAIEDMLTIVGANSLDDLCVKAMPENILAKEELELPSPLSENEALNVIGTIIEKNKLHKSFIGQGYHGTFTPSVILRNLFENPAWYTAYTPYQAEISQGRLELLFNFQTLVSDLTGLPVANASLLDEGTAIAEACDMSVRFFKGNRNKVALAADLHPQNLDVLKTRVSTKEYELVVLDADATLTTDFAALVLPLLDTHGVMHDYSALIDQAKSRGILVILVADPLALCLLKPVKDMGADIAVGSMQRFGVPMGFGGPHAAYISTTEALTRLLPGRIVGLSSDREGRPAYRLALQTREQHIRRDKATSNICTSQVLLANMAAAFAIWHGGKGLQAIAEQVHRLASIFAASCKAAGLELLGKKFFDCVTVIVKNQARVLQRQAYEKGILLRAVDDNLLSINFDELSSLSDVEELCDLFGIQVVVDNNKMPTVLYEEDLRRTVLLPHKAFNMIFSETQMMRFLRSLSDKDLALDRAMIPLGSCTMKLNAAAELHPLSNPKLSQIHPFAPAADSHGYLQLITELEAYLCSITGFKKISFQPNSGAQGEYAGLLAIRRYFLSIGQTNRNICLIPASAHGTNPASAHMAGMEVVVVKCNAQGDIDLEDLQIKAKSHSNNLAALMITYPSTHGVYEEDVVKICEVIHNYGGQVYFDGANLNALVGLARPFDIGADVCHINLHKTFAIPHGGGGPGMGPIGVAKHLVPFLPGHVSGHKPAFAVSSAPYGSASILVISWMYIRLMGAEGLKKATQCAILSANYIAKTLEKHGYNVLYKGKHGLVAHECILDIRLLKNAFNIDVEDIAKRLIDYGFHSPTMSFPVSGTLMIEPTESEPLEELNRFCEAMRAIYVEAQQVADGVWLRDDNPLINAPHTLADALNNNWNHCYSREEACFPTGIEANNSKYFSPVGRIDNVAGDRNLVCSCPPMSEYEG